MKNSIINSKKIISAIILGMVALFAPVVQFMDASAVGNRAFTLSPMSQKVVLMPGETYRGSISLSGPSTLEGEFHYSVSVGPYNVAGVEGGKDDYGDADFGTMSNMNEIVKWITIDNPTGTLVANDGVAVTFSIAVPKDAPAGGQYAALGIREDQSGGYAENSVGVTEYMQMSHIIYAEVSGETRNIGSITENNMPSFLLNNELIATSMVQNDGNVHTYAEYTLQVWPMGSDEEICTNEEEASTSFVMPNTERYHTESCTLPPVGIFRAKQTVKIFGEVSELEKTIIVCPLWLLFLIIFAIAALIIWLVVKAKGRKSSRK